MQLTGLGAIAGGARRNVSGSGLCPRTSSRTTGNPGHGPAPNPSGPPWEAVRQEESVPGEMSLAPAGGRGGREGGSGLLQAALSDSWPRREDCQGRDFTVDGKEGKEGGSCSLAATVTMGRGWRGCSSPTQRTHGPQSTPSTSPIPKKLRVGTMETIIYLNNLCLL